VTVAPADRSAQSRAHRIRVLEGAAELARVSVELRLVRSGGTVKLLGGAHTRAEATPVSPAQLAEARRVGFAVARAADRLFWHPTCLRQAIAVQRMLRRRGIPCRLQLGISRPALSEAHAWVTVEEQTVIGQTIRGSVVPLAGFE
jgi:hypothetical protein